VSHPLGPDDYRDGALARLQDSVRLRESDQWVGAIYLGGRAVECILRALLGIKSRRHEHGHDLRGMLREARSLGIVRAEEDARMQDGINELAAVWHNNLRFVGEARFLRDLRRLNRDKRINGRPVKGDPLKANAVSLLEICESAVARGVLVWNRCRPKSSGC
jgi:hypothetical protein